MSDDGYEPASPYDDYDEYWDEDQQVDLADDLAQHASYSPVWQETPAGELDHYHSDWEYYSDDYYDDDPAIAKYTMDGTHSPNQELRRQPEKRRNKKRKLDDGEGTTTNSNNALLVSTIRGTVWANAQPLPPELYEKGQNEEVELLKNWKDLFLAEDGMTYTFGKGQLREDESWANDMSLADMGLSRTQEAAVEASEGEVLNRYAEEDEESDELGTEDMFDIDDHDIELDDNTHDDTNELRITLNQKSEDVARKQSADSDTPTSHSRSENYAIVSSHKSHRQRKNSATTQASLNNGLGDTYDSSRRDTRSSDRGDSLSQLDTSKSDHLGATTQRHSTNTKSSNKKRRRSSDTGESDALWDIGARYSDTKYGDGKRVDCERAMSETRPKLPPGKMQRIE